MNRLIIVLIMVFGTHGLLWSAAAQDKKKTSKNQKDSVRIDESFDMSILGEETWVPPLKKNRFTGYRTTSYSWPVSDSKVDSTTAEEILVMGFRVQIYHTANYHQAISVRNDAITKFQDEVYVDYESPNYKIRLGDFRRFEQAEELKEYVKNMGYPDAWVIKTKVIIRRQ